MEKWQLLPTPEFYERLTLFRENFLAKFKKHPTLYILLYSFLFVSRVLLEDYLAEKGRDFIALHMGKALPFMSIIYHWLAASGLGIFGLIILLFTLALIVHAYWETLPKKGTKQRKNEIRNKEAPRLQFEFPEFALDHSSPHILVVFVRVSNPTARTIPNVNVCILSIIKVAEPEHSDIARHLETLNGLPLMLHGDTDRPPHRTVDLHAGDYTKFDVVTLQQPLPEVLLHHAIWQESAQKGYWIQRPSSALEPGHYRIQLKAQGHDTPPEVLTIEFANLPNQRRVRQVQKLDVSRETNSTIP